MQRFPSTMKLNCDLGEGLDQVDALVMPHIHMANVACGGHAGDAATMQRCISLALNYGVEIGAHPGYEDKHNMGRVSLSLGREALQSSFIDQVNALEEMCHESGTHITYIKPHGALYNDMMRDEAIFTAILEVCAKYYPNLPLLIQGSLDNDDNFFLAQQFSHYLMFEGFADRRYTDDGYLVPRSQNNAVLDKLEDIVEQAYQFAHNGGVFTESGQWLSIAVDTICVHGDTPDAVSALLAISERLYE